MTPKSHKIPWALWIGACILCLAALWLGRSRRPADVASPSPPPPVPDTRQPVGATSNEDDLNSRLENLVRYAMRGKPHALLDRMEGRWVTRTRYQSKPGGEQVDAQGTSQRQWILEGRFLLEDLDGGDLGLPFNGLGIYGYDAFAEKYTSAWVDTMNTAIMTNLGTYDASNDVVQFTGLYKDPWTGQQKKNRGLTRFITPDQHVLELHITEPDGTEFKMLEITYTRKGAR